MSATGNTAFQIFIKTLPKRLRKIRHRRLYMEPILLVKKVTKTVNGFEAECQSNREISEPICPGAIYNDPNSSSEAAEFHKTIHKSDLLFTFASFGTQKNVPAVGRYYFFRSWMTKDAVDAIKDTGAAWELKPYPSNDSHDHCLMTWESISAYDQNNTEGYFSAEHGWITKAAYDKYIRDDFLRLRC